MPRKSLMRGIAMLTRRSRNSYMRSPRRVTLQPIAWPSRTLNVATDFFALVTAGFCPVILAILAVDHFFVRLEHPHLAAVLERLETDAIAFLRRRIEDQNIGHMQRRLALDDAPLNASLRVRALMLL